MKGALSDFWDRADRVPPGITQSGRDGSFFIELGQEMTELAAGNGQWIVPGDNLGAKYEDIGWIDVVIEHERRFERINRNIFARGSNVALHIWLAEIPFGDPPNGPPSIKIKGNYHAAGTDARMRTL